MCSGSRALAFPMNDSSCDAGTASDASESAPAAGRSTELVSISACHPSQGCGMLSCLLLVDMCVGSVYDTDLDAMPPDGDFHRCLPYTRLLFCAHPR